MTQIIIGIFSNAEVARAAYQTLLESGFDHHLNIISAVNHNEIQQMEESYGDDYLQHKINQGATILEINTDEENWIAAHEILLSLAGEIYQDQGMNEVFNQMYGIPNEPDQVNDELNDETVDATGNKVGTYGYPDDQAYIDPNIGIGNYDLLKPYYPPNEYEKYQEEIK